MAAPDTAIIKQWCRIDGSEFDLVLPVLIAAATALASHETGTDYEVEAMPEAVQQWCAVNIGYWLANPDLLNGSAVPSPFLAGLLDPYRLQDDAFGVDV